MIWLFYVATLACAIVSGQNSTEEIDKTPGSGSKSGSLYLLEGKVVTPPDANPTSFLAETRIIVNYGEFLGFLK